MRIAVAGGTGVVGSLVVGAARARGHEAVVIARSAGVDVFTGAGLAEALGDVDVVLDVSNRRSLSPSKGAEFFTAGARNLRAAEQTAGVGHHLLLSIVGVDRAPYGYFEAKLAQERDVEAGPVPWTILRATQFHEFAEQMLGNLEFAGFHLAPKARVQPVAAREVAERLVELAEAGPSGRVRDLAGPREEQLDVMMRRVGRATGVGGPILAVAMPVKQLAAMRRGEALPGPDAVLARQTFDEWLEERAASSLGRVSAR